MEYSEYKKQIREKLLEINHMKKEDAIDKVMNDNEDVIKEGFDNLTSNDYRLVASGKVEAVADCLDYMM